MTCERNNKVAIAPMPMKIDAEAQMIAGFKEGVFDMSVGDKTFLYLPSYLAYGEKGRGPIKPNSRFNVYY